MQNFVSFLFSHFLFVSTIVLVVCRKSVPTKTRNAPKIVILKYMEGDDYSWKNGNELEGIDLNETVYYIPNDVVILVLHCTANYPVEFGFDQLQTKDEFEESRLWTRMIINKSYRSSPNMYDPSSFQFGTLYFIFGMPSYVSGNYFCRKVTDENVRSNMNIFWEGNAPPYLLNAGLTQKVTTYKTNGKVAIPCLLSVHPDEIDLHLLREVNMTNANNETFLEFTELDTSPTSPNITYQAFQGYVLSYQNSSEVEGRYKCVTEEIDDFVITEVISGVIQVRPPYKEVKGQDIIYDEKSSILRCCSKSGDPPKIMYVYCSDGVSCEMTRKVLESASVNSNFYSGANPNGSCMDYKVHKYLGGMQFRCMGDEIDMIRQMIFPLEDHYPNGSLLNEIYSSYEDLVPENLIRFFPEVVINDGFQDVFAMFDDNQNFEFHGTYYEGKNISFNCKTSPFYFSEGTKITVKFNNGTVAMMQGKAEFNPEDYVKNWYYYSQVYKRHGSIILDMVMCSVTCHAPVWNSKKWIEKTINIKVTKPILPSIKGFSEEEVYWTLNSTETQEIKCEISAGDPYPVLQILKQGKDVTNDTNFKLKKSNQSITLTFLNAAYNVHGDYVCVATNFAGSCKKTFHIYINEQHPWTATIIIIVLCVLLITIIGLVVWKIKAQRVIVTDLRSRIPVTGAHQDD